MKVIHYLTLVFLTLFSTMTFAQVISAEDWNRERLLREQKAMKVLLIWGSINLGTGVAGTISTSDNQDIKWFSAMNGAFGVVNTSLGLLGLNRTQKQLQQLPSLEDGYKDLRRTRNILLINAGLDIGYIVTGVLIRDRVILNDSYSPFERISIFRRRGFGASLIVQGGALLLFDSFTALSLRKSEIHISPVLTPNGAGIGFQSDLHKTPPQGVAWF